jgi:hypothetical protein
MKLFALVVDWFGGAPMGTVATAMHATFAWFAG